ncbi:MAG: hypothetical protein U0414_00250 [Polyangiaceae bacterium]
MKTETETETKTEGADAPSPELRCPQCKTEGPASDFADEQGFACCKKCQSVFLAPEGAGAFKSSVDTPKGLRVVRDEGEISIGWQHDRRPATRLVIMILVLASGVAGLVYYWLGHDKPVWAIIVAAPLAMLSVLMTYTLLLMLVQWQHFDVKKGKLEIRSGPIPVPGARGEFEAKDVSDAYVRLRLQPAGPARGGQPPPMYAFYDVRLRVEKMDTPIGTFPEADRAVYIARELKRTLHLG